VPRPSLLPLALTLLCAACEPPVEAPPPVAEPGRWDEAAPWVSPAPHPCPVDVDPDADLVGELLAEVGLDRSIGIPRSQYEAYGGRIADDPARLDIFHALQEDFGSVPCHAGNVASAADLALASDHPLASLLAHGATQLEVEVIAGGPWPELTGDVLVAALDRLWGDDDWDDRDDVTSAAEDLPSALKQAIALTLLAADEAADLRDDGLDAMADRDYDLNYWRDGANNLLISESGGISPDWEPGAGLFLGSDDGSGVLYSGAVRLAQGLDEADWSAAAAVANDATLRAQTPLGLLVVGGAGDDEYDVELDPDLGEKIVLFVEQGGDDVYRIPAGATISERHPGAGHGDLGGDDTYGYTEVASPYDGEGLLPADAAGRHAPDGTWGPYARSHVARQGAGVLGYGVLLDLGGGADVYRSLRKSQGFATFGAGLLFDDGGDDDYEAENGVQGAATVGLALLVDAGGDDRYRAFGHAQGFGFVSSFGGLVDAGGHDTYEMPAQPVLFYSPQQPGSANSSLGQGTAFGWRRDATGTHLGGGVALLRDAAGNDRYDGSVFVQGVAYWMGLGILADADGDDRYNGLFYAQGATAHFANAAFLEGGGDDHYNADRPAVHSSIGLAHDFSVTVFVDDAGDDSYYGPDRSIGASKCHGLSLFVDNDGDDHYEAFHDRAIGWATDYDWAENVCGNSNTTPSYGFFVDAAGTDTYIKPDATGYGDDVIWLPDDPVDATALEYMGGLDRDGGETWTWAYGAARAER